jgi:hypothetical protein
MVEFAIHVMWTWPTSSTGGVGRSWPDGRDLQLMPMHNKHGHRLAITNYSMDNVNTRAQPQPLTTATEHYAWLHQRSKLGYPIAFQQGFSGVGGTPAEEAQAIQQAINMGARWVEHATWNDLTNTQVQQFNTALKNNVP